MNHLIVFYFLSTLIVGTVSLGTAAFVYIKTRDRAVKHYLLFYVPFTLVIVFYTALTYIETNIPEIQSVVPTTLNYFATLSWISLIFFVPASIHSCLPHSRIKKENGVFAGLAAVVFMGFHIDAFIITSERFRMMGENLISGIFICVMIYCAVVDVRHSKNTPSPPRKRYERWSSVILGFFIPGLICDFFLEDIWSFSFYPILYCGYSFFFVGNLLTRPSSRHDFSQDAFSGDDFFEKFNISNREREIVDLVRKGYSNQKIADTLFISLNTVKAHLRNIYSKLGVKGRFELMVLDRNSLPS